MTRSLAIEYAKEGIRFNAVASGAVDTPLHKDDPKEHLRTLQPMGKIATLKGVVDAVLPGTRRPSNQRGPPRRWRCSRWPLVAATQFEHR